MTRFIELEPDDALRPGAEALVRAIYATRFGARVADFPRRLVALAEGGALLAVAGLRDAGTGFFSQVYLDAPIAAALSAASGLRFRNEELLEVSGLASVRPGAALRLVGDIVRLGRREGRRAGVFTATARLRRQMRLARLPLLDLGAARRDRVTEPEAWGRYYAEEPRVTAVIDSPMRAAWPTRRSVPVGAERGAVHGGSA